jgi:hypothetical protein
MRRGISDVIIIVLLVAIAIMASIGIYFWVGGQATKQPTPTPPNPIVAIPLDVNNGTVLIINTGSTALAAAGLNTSDGGAVTCDSATIEPSQQVLCRVPPKSGSTTIFGANIGSVTVVFPAANLSIVSFATAGFSSSSTTTTSESEFSEGTFSNSTTGSDEVRLDRDWLSFNVSRKAIASSASFPFWPVVVVKSGTKHMMWLDVVGDVDLFYSNASAVTWADELNVTAPDGSQHNDYGDLAVSSGVNHFIWTVAANKVMYTNSSTGYEANITLATGAADTIIGNVTIFVDTSNIAHLGWSNNATIHYANNSTGYVNTTIRDSGNVTFHPVVVVSSGGVVHILWTERFGSSSRVMYTNSSNYSLATQLTPSASDCSMGHHGTAIDSSNVLHMAHLCKDTAAPSGFDQDLFYANSSTGWTRTKIADDGPSNPPMISAGSTVSIVWARNSTTSAAVQVFRYKSNAYAQERVSFKLSSSSSFRRPSVFVDSDGVTHAGFFNSSDFLLYANETTFNYRPFSPGLYTSKVFDSGVAAAKINSFAWSHSTPANTVLNVDLKVGNQSDLSDGSFVNFSNGNASTITGRYYQFRANLSLNLSSTTHNATPVLESVTATYQATTGNLSYTVNLPAGLLWVALNRSCTGAAEVLVTNVSTSGTFYTNALTNTAANCTYKVYGRNAANVAFGPDSFNA